MKFTTIRKPHQIHENLNPWKLRNYMVYTATGNSVNYKHMYSISTALTGLAFLAGPWLASDYELTGSLKIITIRAT